MQTHSVFTLRQSLQTKYANTVTAITIQSLPTRALHITHAHHKLVHPPCCTHPDDTESQLSQPSSLLSPQAPIDIAGHLKQFFRANMTHLLPSDILLKPGIQGLEHLQCGEVPCVPIACCIRYAQAGAVAKHPCDTGRTPQYHTVTLSTPQQRI